MFIKVTEKKNGTTYVRIREILKRDQYSLIEDAHKKLYRMPSQFSAPIKQRYMRPLD